MSGRAQEYFNPGSGDVNQYPGPPGQRPYQQQQQQQGQPPYQQYNGPPQVYHPQGGYPPAMSPGSNPPYGGNQGYQLPPPGGPQQYNYNQGPPPQGWQGGPPPQQQQQQQGYYNQGPPGPMSPPAGNQTSGWGQSNAPPPPMQQSHRQDPKGPSGPSGEEGSRGLTDKLASIGIGHKHSTGDPDSDTDKKKADAAKRAKNHYNPPAGNFQPYPFSPLCPRSDPETIVLQIVGETDNIDRLVGPNQDFEHPSYIVKYLTDSDLKLYRCEFPALDPKKPIWAGTVLPRDGDLDKNIPFKFPWGKWNLDDVGDSQWASDVGMLEGKHWMKWYFIEDTQTYNTNSFVVRNTDIDEERKPTACQVIMKDFDQGRIELPARLYRTMEQLDETILVAMGVLGYWRNYVKQNPDEKTSTTARSPLEKP